MSYNASAEDRQLNVVLKKLNAEEFAPLISFLQRQLAQTNDTLARATEPATLYRLQGRYSAIKGLLEDIAKSRK